MRSTVPLLSLLALSGLLAIPARGARGSVAVLPAVVMRGAVGNGPVVTAALREDLKDHGCTLTSERQVADAIHAAGIDLNRPVPSAALVKLRQKLGVDYLLYPRVLAAGVGIVSGKSQVVALVNVYGNKGSQPVHTNQSTQRVPVPPGGQEGKIVLGEGDASELAGKLLAGFHAK